MKASRRKYTRGYSLEINIPQGFSSKHAIGRPETFLPSQFNYIMPDLPLTPNQIKYNTPHPPKLNYCFPLPPIILRVDSPPLQIKIYFQPTHPI